jgi:hypothetical protein
MAALRYTAVLLTAIVMAAALAHLFSLPNKIQMTRDAYFTAQQAYNGWALLGIALFGAVAAALVLAWVNRSDAHVFRAALIASALLAGSVAVFFAFTFPANRATHNWAMAPDNWDELRRQWEYSHAFAAALDVGAFVALLSALLKTR